MNHLHVYTVHIDPTETHPYENAQFIEESFNWRAFFFSGLWALYHKLWIPAFIIFCGNILIGLALNGDDRAIFLTDLAWSIIIGYQANDWLRKKYRRQGFVTADIVTGDSLLRAEQRFFDRYFASHTA